MVEMDFADINAVVIGDVILDHYLLGTAQRLCPEAPVPVVNLNGVEEYVLGGAANVASNLAALGANVTMVYTVGYDPAGHTIEKLLMDKDIKVFGTTVEKKKTPEKTRIMAGPNLITRLDRESTFDTPVSLNAMGFEEFDFDLVIISDYGKGSITPGVLKSVVETFKGAVHIDPYPPHAHYYTRFDFIYPNEKELEEMGGLDAIIHRAAPIPMIIETRGKNGIVAWSSAALPTKAKAKAKHVYDVTGAGDTVIAAFALAHARGFSLMSSLKIANAAAGVVVGKPGTATCSIEELRKVHQIK